MKVRPRLQNILTFNFIFVGLLPILIFGTITLRILTQGMENEITNKNFLLSKSMAGQVGRYLQEPLTLLEYVGKIVNKKAWVSEDEINDYLEMVIRHYLVFDRIYVLDKDSTVTHVAPFDRVHLDISMAGHPFVKSALEINKPYWSQTFISTETGLTALALTVPFPDGLLVGYLNLAALNAMTRDVKIGSHGYAILIDQEGIVITHPVNTFAAQRFNLKNLTMIRRGLEGNEGSYRDDYLGEEVLGSLAQVPQTGWLVVVIQPVKEAFASVRRITYIFWGGSVLAILLALVIALASLRKALGPLSQLITKARQVRQGHYEFPPQPKSYPEIDELAHDFMLMTRAVQAREAALRESEERYRALIRNVPVGLYRSTLGPEGRFLMANPAIARMFGFESVEDFLRMPVADLYQDSSQRQVFSDNLLKHGHVVSMELRLKRKDGSPFWGSLTAQVILDESGDQKFFDGMVEDITDRKQAEEFIRIQRDLGLALSSTNSLEAALSLSLNAALQVEGMEIGGVYLVGGDSGGMDLIYHEGLSPELIAQARRYEADTPQARWVWKGEPLYTEASDFAFDEGEAFRRQGVRAVAVIPVKHEGQVVACLALASKAQREISTTTRHALESVGSRIGAAIVRIQAQEALRASEEEHRSTLDAMEDWIHVVDSDLRIVLTNKALREWRQLWGVQSDVIGRCLFDVAPFLSDAHKDEYRQVITTGQTLITEKADNIGGKTTYTEARKIPISIKGRVTRVVTIVRDYTFRKIAEEKLRESEERYRLLVENIHDVIFACNENGLVTYASPALEALLGYRPESVLGIHFSDFIHKEDVACVADLFNKAIGGELITSEFRLYRKSGEVCWVRCSARPSIIENRLTGLQGIIADITDRRNSEEQIKLALLEKEVLLKEIHHRVKNNMQVITSLLSLQTESLIDNRIKKVFIESLNRVRAMALVHEILYRSDSLANIDFKDYVTSLTQSLLSAYDTSGGGIELDIRAEGVDLDIDQAAPCGLVINELVTNSLKYAFPHGGPGKISILARMSEEKEMEIEISDNGVGFPEGVEWQNTNTLGLGLVNILAEGQLKAKIEMRRNGGTVFRMRFKSKHQRSRI